MYVPVAQLDKASDYESEDWGFKSLQEYFGFVYPLFLDCARPGPLRRHGFRRYSSVGRASD